VPDDGTKSTDDVAGPAAPSADSLGGGADELEDTIQELDPAPEPDAVADPPPAVNELAVACVRYVSARYGIRLDYMPETLSLLDQWVRDARDELKERPELGELVQSSAGAYLGEVVRRTFGANWITEGANAGWRLCMSTVFCAFNPVGLVREALLLGEAEGWHAHFELDPGEKELIVARLAALPEVSEDEYYAPSTRFDVVNLVVDALRERMRGSGLADVRFSVEDYAGT
jgi:hypothetical protein